MVGVRQPASLVQRTVAGLAPPKLLQDTAHCEATPLFPDPLLPLCQLVEGRRQAAESGVRLLCAGPRLWMVSHYLPLPRVQSTTAPPPPCVPKNVVASSGRSTAIPSNSR